MLIYEILHKKRHSLELDDAEIRDFVSGFTSGEIPDYQAAALLMAICINGMSERETVTLTDAMTRSGDRIDLSSVSGVKVDKHSTGGVGDKTSLVVCPIVSACGVPVAKMSGRGLGHTGGTLDKLESIPGMSVSLPMEMFLENVRRIGFSLIGQTGHIAPADKKLYALRDVTATVDSIPLIASSIMSKKLASGADAIVLDVKTGSGAFMKSESDSIELARTMVKIGCGMNRATAALITDMDTPLGRAVGNSIEVIEAVNTLRGYGESDLLELSLALAANMIALSLKKPLDECRIMAERAVESGAAFEKLCAMVESQGGDVEYIRNPELFSKAAVHLSVTASQSGYIAHMDAERIGLAASAAGAGRMKLTDEIDHSAGIILLRKTGEYVQKDDAVAEIYASDERHAQIAAAEFADALTFSIFPPAKRKLIYAIVNSDGITVL